MRIAWCIPRNADFLNDVLVNSEVTYLQRSGQGHFVLWEEAELIRDTLLEKFNQGSSE